MVIRRFLLIWVIISPYTVLSQKKDTIKIKTLEDVNVIGFKTVRGTGHMQEIKDGIIYAGKKNEVIIVDSLDANKAINNTRQILGRIPGLNIVETEGGGFTSNGIGTRGLNPTQSIEMNTRQNGYNISADIYGYNEAYYIPPMEAVQRIIIVRGAASLQFGAQFGGLVNYVIEDAPLNKCFEFTTSLTTGSFGMYNSFNSFAGTYKKISYYGFIQYRTLNGYRRSSQQWQLSGFGKVQFNASEKLKFSAEYSLLRNRLQMPGGLTDSLFNINPQTSTRARNWLKSPWNIIATNVNYTASGNAAIRLSTTFLFSNRSLVWKNEEGGPAALDVINPVTNTFMQREVGSEAMNNITSELRFSLNYRLGKQKSIFASGLRYTYAWFKREGAGQGTTGSDFDLSISGDWGYNLDFTTTNLATFAENIFKITKKFTLTPGFRLEYLNSTLKGYKTIDNVKEIPNEGRSRTFPLFGIGSEFKATVNTNIYANISQAYRPIDYNQLEPFGVTSKIDTKVKDASGYNADLGYRGTIKNYLNFDVGVFYMAYNNRIGIILKTDPVTNQDYTLRTNVANSVNKGIESYIEFNILKYINQKSKYGLSIFNSFTYINAKYTKGEFKGNRIEAAVKTINRVGVILNNSQFSSTLQVNNIGDSYGDASNAKVSQDPIAGYIPAYTVLDLSSTYTIKNYAIKAGCNNIADKSYFTRRTDEYPGPGIIPSVGRSFYFGLSAKF